MHTIRPLERIRAEIVIPSDKSISHRAVLIAALSKGSALIRNFLHSNDTIATLECVRKVGVSVKYKE